MQLTCMYVCIEYETDPTRYSNHLLSFKGRGPHPNFIRFLNHCINNITLIKYENNPMSTS